MQNFQEQSLVFTRYLRARQAILSNELNQLPRIAFSDEEVTTMPDGTVTTKAVDGCAMEYQSGFTFQLVDPNTGIPIPDQFSSLDQIELLMYSLWIKMEQDKAAAKAV